MMQKNMKYTFFLILLMTLCASTASFGQDRRLYGLSSQWWYIHEWTNPDSPDRLDKFIAEYKALGANVIRLGLDWQVIEPRYGNRQYGEYKRFVDAFKANGIEVILLFYTAPKYMVDKNSPYQDKCPDNYWCVHSKLLRDSVLAFNRVVKDVVTEFSNVTYWEFWNEPQFDGAMGVPDEFAFWYRRFVRKVRNVNPQARVSMGTIYAEDHQNHVTIDFVKNVYSLLSENDRPDAISLHPYQRFTGDTSPSFANINKALIRSIHNFAPSAKIWITEYGWNLYHNFTQEQQAQGIKNSLTWMESKNYIQFANFHMLHDWGPACVEGKPCNSQRMGLVNKAFLNPDTDYKRKLPWCAFREMATGQVQNCPIKVEVNGIAGFQDDDLEEEAFASQAGEDDLTLYPNPVTSTLHVKLKEGQPLTALEIEDMNGNKVRPSFTQKEDHAIVNVAFLAKGIYVIRIHTPSGVATRRFMK